MVFNYKKVVHLSEVYKVLNELEKFQSINKNVELNFAIEKLTKKFRKNLIKALIGNL